MEWLLNKPKQDYNFEIIGSKSSFIPNFSFQKDKRIDGVILLLLVLNKNIQMMTFDKDWKAFLEGKLISG